MVNRMKITQTYKQKLQFPESIGSEDLGWLQQMVTNYPYLQSAHALLLKALYQQEDARYNTELKTTAAYTTDRDLLFDFIISDQFNAYQPIDVEAIDVFDVEEISFAQSAVQNNSQPAYIAPEAEKVVSPENTALEEKLDIGKPLKFNASEKMSFTEWLQLTKTEPLSKLPEAGLQNSEIKEEGLVEKLDIIDKFIENNPKIAPVKTHSNSAEGKTDATEPPSTLMTETLARIYLEQKKYQKAIQAYEILILKYPEKSSFFAERIEDIKKLQQHNS